MKKLRLVLGCVGVSLLVSAASGCDMEASVDAGDYTVFRIASVSSPKLSGQCGQDPDATSTHKSTFRAGATLLAYGVPTAAGDQLYLDVGGEVLVGALQADGSYEFKGSVTDTQTLGGQSIIDSDHDGIDDNDETIVDADGDGLNDKAEDPMVDTDADTLDDRFSDSLVDADQDGKDDRFVTLPGDTTVTTKNNLTISFTPAGKAIAGDSVDVATTSCDGECVGFDAVSCTTTISFVGIEIDDQSIAVPIGSDDHAPTP
jgi:hypothetical protein